MFTLKTTGVLLFLLTHGSGVSTGWEEEGKGRVFGPHPRLMMEAPAPA